MAKIIISKSTQNEIFTKKLTRGKENYIIIKDLIINAKSLTKINISMRNINTGNPKHQHIEIS